MAGLLPSEIGTPGRLGWARILAIAVTDAEVGFAFFVVVLAGLDASGGSPGEWTDFTLACSLAILPVAIAGMLWVGARRRLVWLATGVYALQAFALGGWEGPSLAFGVLPVALAAAFYSLPRRRPQAALARTADA